MKNFKFDFLVFLIGLLVGLFLMRSCNGPKNDLGGLRKIVITKDTIWAKDTIYSFKTKFIKGATDSFLITIDKIDSNTCKYIRTYRDTFNDSNLTIYSNDSVVGLLKSKQISYKLKVPLTINITKEITIDNTSTSSILGGVEVSTNMKILGLSPFIGFTYMNKMINYKYDILNKTHNIGISITIRKYKI